jgi:hypothetical protein
MVGRHTSVAEAVILAADDKWAEDYYGLDRSSRTGSWSGASDWDSSQTSAASNRMTSCLAGLKKYTPLLIAMLMCQVGMILFNLGLTYGFAALGDMTGVTLPLAFLRLPEDPRSPYYSFAGKLLSSFESNCDCKGRILRRPFVSAGKIILKA